MRRLATDHDLQQVFAIYTHEAVAPYLSFDPMPIDSFRTVFQDLVLRGCFFIYERSGRVAGFYEVSRYLGRAQHVAYLGSVAVRPDLHGAGVAAEMINDAVARLRASGVMRIELFVETDNARAIAFYQKLGFEIEGTLRQFYKRASDAHYVDDHVMGLLL